MVDDLKFLVAFYQQALGTTLVMGIKDSNVRTELLKRHYEIFSNVVEVANNESSIQAVTSRTDTKKAAMLLDLVLVLYLGFL